MSSNRTVHVRIVSPVTGTDARSEDALRSLEHPGLRVSFDRIAQGPASIETEYELATAVPPTVAKIVDAERDGVDAVVIDCMGDPGLRAAREMVRIPVVGPNEACMHIAAMLSHKFSIITILLSIRADTEIAARQHGLSARMASCRAIEVPVLSINSNIELTVARLIEESELAIRNDGAHSIIFGCTGFSGLAERVRNGLIERGLDVPVLDPIPAAVNMAAAMVRSKLTHSAMTFQPPKGQAHVHCSTPSKGGI